MKEITTKQQSDLVKARVFEIAQVYDFDISNIFVKLTKDKYVKIESGNECIVFSQSDFIEGFDDFYLTATADSMLIYFCRLIAKGE